MRIENLNIMADEYRRTARLVMVSHFHRDHLVGIHPGNAPVPILCSPITARCLVDVDGIPEERIIPIEVGSSYEIFDRKRRVVITALDANHCPGSLMFHLEWEGKRALYTGDFRLNDAIRAAARRLAGVDWLYVDQTYNAPQYCFPTQEQAIEQAVALVRERRAPQTFVAVYTIGKNRIIEAIHRETGQPFYMTEEKRRVYAAIGLSHLVTNRREETPFRAYARGYLEHYYPLSREAREGNTLVIIPTGWAIGQKSSHLTQYIPYSEHCDYRELNEFLALIQPRQVITIQG